MNSGNKEELSEKMKPEFSQIKGDQLTEACRGWDDVPELLRFQAFQVGQSFFRSFQHQMYASFLYVFITPEESIAQLALKWDQKSQFWNKSSPFQSKLKHVCVQNGWFLSLMRITKLSTRLLLVWSFWWIPEPFRTPSWNYSFQSLYILK